MVVWGRGRAASLLRVSGQTGEGWGGANRQAVPTDGTAGSKAGRGVCWRVKEKNVGPQDSWWAGPRWRPWVKEEPGKEEETPGQPGRRHGARQGCGEGSWWEWEPRGKAVPLSGPQFPHLS